MSQDHINVYENRQRAKIQDLFRRQPSGQSVSYSLPTRSACL